MAVRSRSQAGTAMVLADAAVLRAGAAGWRKRAIPVTIADRDSIGTRLAEDQHDHLLHSEIGNAHG
jgi:hypothetical protein